MSVILYLAGLLAIICLLLLLGKQDGSWRRWGSWLRSKLSRDELPPSLQELEQNKELKLNELYVSAERLRIQLRKIEEARTRFAVRIPFWQEVHEKLQQIGSRRYVLDSLCFSSDDPLALWFSAYVPGLNNPWNMTDSDEAQAELVIALEAQRRSWSLSEVKIQTELDGLEEQITRLEQDLGIKPLLDPREAKRQELKQLRARVANLEGEILEEENRNAPGPQRLKRGVSTDD